MPELPDPKHRQHPWRGQRAEVRDHRAEVSEQTPQIDQCAQPGTNEQSSLASSHPLLSTQHSALSTHNTALSTCSPSVHRPQSSSLCQYAELHVTSNFTFLTGSSHPDELVQQAANLGHAAIAITDRNSLAGIVRAHVAAKEIGIRLAVGCQVELEQG